MCLYPKIMRNRRYTPTKKNNYNPPTPDDPRKLYIAAGCQNCMECRKQKARGWNIRLQEEIKTDKSGQFITLTFSNESIYELQKQITGLEGYELDNEIATIATRRFLERWRKKYGTSVKHWLITELGHEGTENVHMHGIIFSNNKQDIIDIWKYGYVYIGKYVNERTVNYTIKYVYKQDEDHKEYKSKILTSPGIGNKYTERQDAQTNQYKTTGTNETFKTRGGQKIALPTYWRNKIYTEEEREKLWIEKLEKKERWVDGQKIDVSKGEEIYYKALEIARAKNKKMGYGDDSLNWERIQYENSLRKLKLQERIKKFGDMENND